MRDLTDVRWMYVKALLFACLALFAGAALVVNAPTLETVFLVVVLVWAAARLYYFCFYVIEKYVDPQYRFSGVVSALVFLLRRNARRSRD